MKLVKGDKIEANKMVMVITGETDKAYLGFYEYKGKPVGQCSLLKEMLENPHFKNNYKKLP